VTAALDVTIALTALEFRKTDRTAALLLVPYLAWWVLCCNSSCQRLLSGGFHATLFVYVKALDSGCQRLGPAASHLVQTAAAVRPSDIWCAPLRRCTYATALNYNIMVNNSPQVGSYTCRSRPVLLTCRTERR
jgi:TspO/MBR family